MIAALALAAVAAALPEGTARYRAEIGGIAVGVAELRITCAGTRCDARMIARLRKPEEAGGAVDEGVVEVEVDRAGRYQGGALRTLRGGARSSGRGVRDAVPSVLVELALIAEARDDVEICVPWFNEDEERPTGASACGRRAGGALAAEIGGTSGRLVPDPDGFLREMAIGRFRWIRDPGATVPARPPRLAGTRVGGPADPRAARVFCGVRVDGPPPAAPAGIPAARAEGESCREKSAAWLAAARARGHEARLAVGVAWDGAGFVWHEWAEVRTDAGWLPVDPAFHQLPARGPRFTLARFTEEDRKARDAAGTRILNCWGDVVAWR